MRDGFLFLALLAVVCGSRSLYHLAYLLAAAALLALGWRDGRRALIAAAVPVLLVVSLYAKNKVLFGHFAASTWTGMSLGHLTIDPLPREEAERLVAAGTLSPASAHPAFSRARVYQGAYFDPPPATRVRALYWEEKTTGAPNYNHAAYIRISEDLLRDSLWVLRHRPGVYLASVREAWSIYFRGPGELRFLGAENIDAIRPARDLYDAVFFLRRPGPGGDADAPPRYWGLIFGLPAVFAVGLVSALGRGSRPRPRPPSAARWPRCCASTSPSSRWWGISWSSARTTASGSRRIPCPCACSAWPCRAALDLVRRRGVRA